MHPLPQYPVGYHDGSQDGNLLYGTEYQDTGNSGVSGRVDLDAACAVCQRAAATQVYVQWGRETCSNGHTTEYRGLVMGDYYTHARRTSLCVDRLRAAHRTSSASSHNGALLYPSEMERGASDESLCVTEELPIPQKQHARE